MINGHVGLAAVPRLQHVDMARLAQSAERRALNLVVVGSSPTVGVFFGTPRLQAATARRSLSFVAQCCGSRAEAKRESYNTNGHTGD